MGRLVLFALMGSSIGVAAGIGGFTFIYAKGGSYLTDDPKACANCHVMSEQYEGWQRSSHHAVATCNDCHTPAGFVAKYAVKASNGFFHSLYFTTGNHPDPIRIRPHNREVTERACRKCHAAIAEAIEATPGTAHQQGATECLRCHNSVGHPEPLGHP